jgi:ligand-binding sensor domain-containing protein/signal transduction histidine kinase
VRVNLRHRRQISLSFCLAWLLTVPISLYCKNSSKNAALAELAPIQAPQQRITRTTISYSIVDGTDIRFSRPNAPEGLSLTKLGPIVQDNQGFLWFGSQHGLFRFDGYSYKEFVHDPADPHSLSCPLILTLFKDRDGSLWVGCERSLDHLDLQTETFTHYPVPFVVHVSQEKAGSLWLSTPSGLYALDPTTGRSRRYMHDPTNPFSLSSSNVRSSGEDREGSFWVTTSEGMDKFDRSSGKVLLHIPLRGSSYVFSFYEDREGTFWIYRSSGTALAKFDRSSNTLTEFILNKGKGTSDIATGVTGMIEDQNGTLWMGTIGAGLLKLDREHQTFMRYRNNVGDSQTIGENSIASLAVDHEGIMWAALGGMGLTNFAPNSLPFKRYRHDFGNPSIKGEPFVGAIFEDEHGTLWIGTHEALNRIDQNQKHFISYHIGDPGEYSDVISICTDHSGNLWIGTYDHGLFRFDRNTGRSKRYRHNPSDPNSLSDDIIPRLLVDHNGTLWAATDDALDRFDAVNDRFITYRSGQQARGHYLEITEDRHGTLWLGTVSSGLQQFNPATGQFITYEHEQDRTGSISDNRVNSIHFDRAGTMWVGTQDGLDKFDPETRQFTTYSRRDGLPGSTVGCVLEDDQGNLWMSTNNGVANFDVSKRVFKNYSIADGLPGLDLTGWGACFKSPSREMFFGGFAGATSFSPDNVQKSSYLPPIVLTDFRVFGTNVAVKPNSILTKTINYTDSITLSYKQNIFSISFSALSYANSSTNRYRYMLDGIDHDWNEVGSGQRMASYTTLPHGIYHFHVQGAESRGPWTQPGREIRIEILPAWWLTGWFRTACVLAILLLLWMLYQIRVFQLKRQFNAALEARVDERTRIARELHDTLLQSFQAVMLKLYSMRSVVGPAEARQKFDALLEQGQQAITEGRDAVQEMRSSTIVKNDLARALGTLAEGLVTEQNAHGPVEFKVAVQGETRDLHPILRDEVYRIASEAIRNAFRHSGAQRIEIEINYEDRQLGVSILDNGRGIDPKVLDRGGREGHYGLTGMHERAKLAGGKLTAWSKPGSGTKIELIIPGTRAYIRSSSTRQSMS